MKYDLRLDRLRVPVSMGIHDYERDAKQIVEVWVRVTVELKGTADHIESVFDYDDVRNFILELADTRHFELQESFASEIAQFCGSFDLVIGGMVRTSKPDIFKDADGIGCVLEWSGDVAEAIPPFQFN